MELEKRKREADGGANGKRGKFREEDGGGIERQPPPPPDEEVEEFFAIMKRIQVAIKYFQKRDGGELTASTPWNPAFKREDFDEAKKDPKGTEKKHIPGLDLNSDPAPEEKPGYLSDSA